jgi:hypothetical protein
MKLFFDEKGHTDYANHCISPEILLEQDKWNFTKNLEEADVVPIDYYTEINLNEIKLKDHQLLVVWFYETTGNTFTPEKCRQDTRKFFDAHYKTLVFHTNELDNKDVNYIPSNVMYNRQRMFCVNYSYICENLQWTRGIPKVAFELTDINKVYSNENKKFLVPNRIFSNAKDTRNILRQNLKNYLQSINASMYLSDPEKGIYFKPNGITDVSKIDTVQGGSWHPIDNYYYNTSYVGIHTETIWENPDIFYPTEKYFDNLIKGNFPLIFAAPNFVSNLKKFYNFRFPDWIDYSYDNIYNYSERIAAFYESINKVSKLSLLDLHSLYLRDKENILEHNKKIFYTKPCMLLYNKIIEAKRLLNY